MEELKQKYYSVINDAWFLMKNNLGDHNWDDIYQSMTALNKKYENTEQYDFAIQIIGAAVEELRRIHNE